MKFTTLIVTIAAALAVGVQAQGSLLSGLLDPLVNGGTLATGPTKPSPASVVGVPAGPLGIVSPAVIPAASSNKEKENLSRRDEVNQNLDRRIFDDDDRDIIDQVLYDLGVYGHYRKRNDFMKNEKEILKIRQDEDDDGDYAKGDMGTTDDKAGAMKRQDDLFDVEGLLSDLGLKKRQDDLFDINGLLNDLGLKKRQGLFDDVNSLLGATGLKKRDFVGALLDAADKATNGLLIRRDDGIETIDSDVLKSEGSKKRAVVANVDIDAKVDILVKLYLDTLAQVSVGIKADITTAILAKIKLDAKVDITAKIRATVMAAVNLKVDALIQAHIAAHIKASLLSIVNVDIAANVDAKVTLENLHIWLKAALHVVVDHLNVDLYVDVLGLLHDVLTVNIEDLLKLNTHLNIDADVVVNAAIAAVVKVDAKVLVQ